MSFQARLQRIRQQIIRQKTYAEGVLGDGSGTVYASTGKYWVRFPAGSDTNGNVTYTAALPIRYAGEGTIPAREGIEVLVKVDYDSEMSIFRVKPDYYDRAGIDSRAFNAGESLSKWIDVRNIIRWLARPVGSIAGALSTKLTIRENPFFVDDALEWQTYAGTVLAANKVELSTYIPVADYHCLVIVFFDTFLNTYKVAASTVQLITVALDSTDYDECWAQLDHNEYHPLVSLELGDGQASVSNDDVLEDLRQIMNSPRVMGFPNPIVLGRAIYIRSTHQEITYNLVVIGNLVVAGDMIVL